MRAWSAWTLTSYRLDEDVQQPGQGVQSRPYRKRRRAADHPVDDVLVPPNVMERCRRYDVNDVIYCPMVIDLRPLRSIAARVGCSRCHGSWRVPGARCQGGRLGRELLAGHVLGGQRFRWPLGANDRQDLFDFSSIVCISPTTSPRI